MRGWSSKGLVDGGGFVSWWRRCWVLIYLVWVETLWCCW